MSDTVAVCSYGPMHNPSLEVSCPFVKEACTGTVNSLGKISPSKHEVHLDAFTTARKSRFATLTLRRYDEVLFPQKFSKSVHTKGPQRQQTIVPWLPLVHSRTDSQRGKDILTVDVPKIRRVHSECPEGL